MTFVTHNQSSVFVYPRKEPFYYPSFGVSASSIHGLSTKYSVAVTKCFAHSSVGSRVVTLVCKQLSARRDRCHGRCECRFKKFHIGVVSRCIQEGIRNPLIVYDCCHFGCLPSTVCRVSTNAIYSVNTFHESGIHTAELWPSLPHVKANQVFICGLKHASSFPFVHCFEHGNMGHLCWLQVTPLHPCSYYAQNRIVCVVEGE